MMKINALKPYPFSFLVVLSSILVIISIIVVTVLSALVNSQVKGVLGDMSERVLTSKSELITHRIEMYMNQPRQTNAFLSRLLEDSESASPVFIRKSLLDLMEKGIAGGQPVARVGYASASGSYTAFSRNEGGDPFLINTQGQGSTPLIVYNGISEASGIARTFPEYDLLTRPWYIQARKSTESFWTTNYKHISENSGLVMSYRTPVRAKDGHFRGAVVSDIHPAMMRTFLQTLKPFPGSTLMILDNQGNIVATTHDHHQGELAKVIADSSRGVPVSLPSLKAYHPQLAQALAEQERANYSLPVRIDLDEGHFYLLSRTLNRQIGLNNWRLVILSPRNIPVALLEHYRLVTILIMSAVILLSLLLVIGLLVHFNRPLKIILRKAVLLGKQPWKMETGVRLFPEVARLNDELGRTSDLIAESIAAQQKLAEEDPDTGLPNFAGLCKQVTNDTTRNMVALIHITNFSVINMTLGSAYASELVKTGVSYLKKQLPRGSLLARIRTDKFVIIFPGTLDEHQIEAHTRWLEELLLTTQSLDNALGHLFLRSAGVVVEPVTRERLVAILLNTSIACHNAAEKGNGSVVRFSAEMHDEALNNVHLHQQLRYAVSNDEFHLVMQPIVDLSNPAMCTEGECLIRWQSKELGFVPPDKFIALAESTGLIVQIGRWVIETACRELADFIRRGAPENFKLHVNISALQLKQPDFSAHLFDCIAKNSLSPENICIELTERVLVDDTGTAIALLAELRRQQITVALDDFGSGYSSLSYLHRLPFDILKIDRNFVKDAMESEKSRTMISSVVSIAQGLNVPLVAEGIENAELGKMLLGMGCEKAQGYYYGRPSHFNEWSVGDGEFRLEIAQ